MCELKLIFYRIVVLIIILILMDRISALKFINLQKTKTTNSFKYKIKHSIIIIQSIFNSILYVQLILIHFKMNPIHVNQYKHHHFSVTHSKLYIPSHITNLNITERSSNQNMILGEILK